MLHKVLAYIQKYHMFKNGDTIVAGISGGADSVCLLIVLLMLKEKMHLNLHIVHVNHGIRKEAVKDAEFVKKMCDEQKIPFYLIEADVKKVAKDEQLSEEEAGRKVRYDAFYKILEALELSENEHAKIAVAHNKNDRAETTLFHLFRGSGLKGLQGIAPVRGAVIRPLLCVERSEIEEFLRQKKVVWCTDATNAEDIYTRNRIRNHVIPYAEENICQNIVAHINETAEMAEETEIFIQNAAHRYMETCVKQKGKNSIEIDCNLFLQAEEILQKYIVRECIAQLADSKKDITLIHTKDIISLFTKQVGKAIILPYGLKAQKRYETVLLTKEKKPENTRQRHDIHVEIPGNYFLENMGIAELTVFEAGQNLIIPEKTYTKWFDYDKIGKPLSIRNRLTGDYLTITEDLQKQSLKAYMINQKIEKDKREQQLLLAEGNHVLWVIGKRISQYYKVTEQTKTILQVQIKEN